MIGHNTMLELLDVHVNALVIYQSVTLFESLSLQMLHLCMWAYTHMHSCCQTLQEKGKGQFD